MKTDCHVCKIILSKDEIGLNKKMLGRSIEKFKCLDCLSDYLGCSKIDLQEKIEQFKMQGCTLFQ